MYFFRSQATRVSVSISCSAGKQRAHSFICSFACLCSCLPAERSFSQRRLLLSWFTVFSSQRYKKTLSKKKVSPRPRLHPTPPKALFQSQGCISKQRCGVSEEALGSGYRACSALGCRVSPPPAEAGLAPEWLRAHTALPEDLSSIPSIHIRWLTTAYDPSSRGI